MISEAAMASKKPNKDSSGKKVFSVPVGKLRNKTSARRSGSCSGSGSRSKYHNRLLRKNNRDLACALSKQKELNKNFVDENLRLTSLNHESQLKVIGLEKKISRNKQAFIDYRECVIGHIKDAVKHSVLVTESLKLAMTTTVEDAPQKAGGESPIKTNETFNGSNSLANPQRHRVNPMISGYTIRYPTINLKRVNMEEVERVTDKSEHVAENVPSPNTVDLVQQSSDLSLSTCVEEDEEECDSEIISTDPYHEVQEGSLRRRIVSCRNRTIDKEKERWDPQVADPNVESKELTEDQSDFHRKVSILSRSTISPEKLKTPSKQESTSMPESLTMLSPVVTLNDVSKLLQKNNSVNVLKISLDNHKVIKVANPSQNPTDVEKENLPSNKMLPASSRQKRLESSSLDKSVKSVDTSGNKKGATTLNFNRTQPDELINDPACEEDPLEGTSWMYTNLYRNETKKNKRDDVVKKTHRLAARPDGAVKKNGLRNQRKKVETNFSKSYSSIPKDDVPEYVTAVSTYDMNVSVAEKNADIPNDVNVQHEGVTQCLQGQEQDLDAELPDTFCRDSLRPSFNDSGEMHDAIKNNLVLQSTPKSSDDKKSPKNCASQVSFSNQLDSSDKPSSLNVSKDFLGLIHSPKNSRDDGDDISPLDYAKLQCNAMVTVRVKRLKCQDIVNEQEVNRIDDIVQDVQILDSQKSGVFLGFNDEDISLEDVKAMKDGLTSLSLGQFMPRENSRGTVDTSCSYTTAYDSSKSSEIEICDKTSIESNTRPRRKAAPTELKEATLNKKLRRDTIGSKKAKKKRKK